MRHMKYTTKITTQTLPVFLATCLLVASAVLPVRASLLLYEGFDYEAPIVGKEGGSGFNAAWAQHASPATINLKAGLDYTDTNTDALVATGGSVGITSVASGGISRTFDAITAAADTTTTYWLSFVGNTAWSATGSGNNFFASLMLRSGTTDILSVGAFGSSPNWRVRANNSNYSSATGVPTSSTQAFVVVRIDVNTATAGNDAVYLWINPALGTEPSIGAATGSITGTNLWNSFSLDSLRISVNENAPAGATKSISLDELRLGTSYADVAVTVVPEVASTAVFLGGMLFVVVILLQGRRSRST
ncbi:cell wall anchor protein [Geminisphaera colitermitum]|uniref:cell wall anchor protein n=1 Tax=Geminisphaera colitermitum TaxID=1148786 RepID=UPI000158C541|nr:cell wall anchor protein [Geminisphaera colitermitum]